MKLKPVFRAFTLVEVLIGMGLAAMLMLAVLSSFLFLGRSLTKKALYQSLDSASRITLAYLAEDVGKATAVASPGSTGVTLTLSGTETAAYSYNSGAGTLTRTLTQGGSSVSTLILLRNITASGLSFSFYDSYGGSSATLTNFSALSVKVIEIHYTLQTGNAPNGTQTHYEMPTARFQLRNKPLLGG